MYLLCVRASETHETQESFAARAGFFFGRSKGGQTLVCVTHDPEIVVDACLVV